MSGSLSEAEMYKIARQRVNEKKGFYSHLAVYILVNIMLVLIWLFTSGGGFPWFLFPLCGWGIGVISHGLGVFVFQRHSSWERTEIEKEVAKLKAEQD